MAKTSKPQTAEWIETYKGAVLASEYDPETHMNTQLYSTRFDQATWFLLSAIGITPATMKKEGRRFAVIRQSYQMMRELRGGDLVAIESGFVGVGGKYIRFIHRMSDNSTGALVATSDCTAVIASLKTGKSVALPAKIRNKANTLLVSWNVAKLDG
jgi:acyl-CoA thioesterase FadM